MSELLPTIQAEAIRHSLTDYLTTTFALTDAGARSALDDFLSHPEHGMFKGPYVRLRLPFRPADSEASGDLEWDSGLTPYGHQAAAFARLTSQVDGQPRRPLPTLVTTGTGSGKTEAFLYPILDHVLRAKRRGVTGMKALILYPMNALANDQAGRLANLISSRKELAAVRAGLYTGQDQVKRTKVSAAGLITDRYEMRDKPPDILLTNYKMLDQLLLREADQSIWRESASSLQYLVLDEFHTYDGAQGTDVAMLLRRLGLALRHFAPSESLSGEELARPLGKVTPVATSATLGGDDPEAMLEFAATVFGEQFPPDSVISESRLSVAEWVSDASERLSAMGVSVRSASAIRASEVAEAIRRLGDNPDAARLTDLVMATLFASAHEEDLAHPVKWSDQVVVESAMKAHPIVSKLVGLAGEAQPLDALPGRVLGATFTSSLAATGRDDDWATFLNAVIAALGHVRAEVGRSAVSVEVHYWLRELSRIDRVADTAAVFRWSDDGPAAADDVTVQARPAFPAIFCRRCGRSGWAVKLAPVGNDLASDDSTIRRDSMAKSGRIRYLVHAPSEAEVSRVDSVAIDGLRWFSVKDRQLVVDPPEENDPDALAGWVLPVLTVVGDNADKEAETETCPSCGQPDAIRFLGSAIATLLSVSLSTLFGSPSLDSREKRALVFTDSVQDAAHRAGFVQARAHAMMLRSLLRAGLEGGELTLDTLVAQIVAQAGDDRSDRYRLLPPDCVEREAFLPFWQKANLRAVPGLVRGRVTRRMGFDAALEFGLNSRLGRTLELTGSVAVEVAAGSSGRIVQIARDAIDSAGWQNMLGDSHAAQVTNDQLASWVRGVLDRIRTQGGINHPWLERYCQEDGRRFFIWGGRRRDEGMPAFPKGRPAPAFPRVGSLASTRSAGDGLDSVGNAQSWYAVWTAKALNITAHDAGRVAQHLLAHLARSQVLTETMSTSGARVYGIPQNNIILSPINDDGLKAGAHMLECSTCKALTPGSAASVDQLEHAPCLAARCQGRLLRKPVGEGFYRRMYSAFSMRRIVAREHTGLLDDATRLAYEDGFKSATTQPGAPNVLVATPTLEMGIDIGDLSAVFLASLPKTVAQYTQRVGRAGRLTGNALAMTYVTGRGEYLPKLGDPLSVIDGDVRPPATYLAAEEILYRQYTAALIDTFARQHDRPHPRKAAGALGASTPGSFLGDLIELGERRGLEFDHFAEGFRGVTQESLDRLKVWLDPTDGPGTSRFARRLIAASQAWRKLVDVLTFRIQKVEELLPELQKQADSPASTDEDKRALRSGQAALTLAHRRRSHLRDDYWIAVLEEYGILPNYTLLDDTATLDVGLSWIDPETAEFKTDHLAFSRGATLALREFAPGAQFYARGLQIAVDAVDLGQNAEAIHPWSLCAACGYAQQLDAEPDLPAPTSCPHCGDTGIGDSGQR
ncbi:MAG: DEAD/DEAH box helicase, partial [Propionibacteriaceae bacterium]|nr:DEAD/DEAH box helicase [Propionibacteriaceae bacterium]